MPRWIDRTVHALSGTTFRLIFLIAGFFVLWGMLAPVTTIIWWLNQTAESLGLENDEEKPDLLLQPSTNAPTSKIDCYIVFLAGVGNFSPDEITPGEKYFIDRLAERHSNCVVVRDVFPYSVVNRDLSQDLLAPLWEASKETGGILSNVLVQVRNLWRFAISADDRYGPVYNLSIAYTIVDRMNAAYPIAQSDKPINLILISTSGGTQVALGTTEHLRDWIPKARIVNVSIGGTFEGRAGFNDANHVYHLYGNQDWVQTLPRVVFPARWRFVVGSPVNQARRQGRYTVCNVGDREHTGSKGYFGDAIPSVSFANAPNGIPYVKQTIEQVDRLPIWSIDQPLTSRCPVQKTPEK